MSRPSLFNTVLPVVALGVGVMIGAYMPKGILPGTDAPTAQTPTPQDMLADLVDGLSGFRSPKPDSAAAGHAGTPATGTGNAGSASPAGQPAGEAATSAELARQRQAAAPFDRQLVTIVGVPDGMRVEVEAFTATGPLRQVVKLHAIDESHPNLHAYMQKFIGKSCILDLANPPFNAKNELVGLIFVIDDHQSLNAKLYTAIKSAR